MERLRVLFSWIGHADLLAAAAGADEATLRRVREALGRAGQEPKPPGPVQTLIGCERFDEVHLLSNDPKWLADLFVARAAPDAVVHRVDLPDPTDYGPVFAAAEATVAAVVARKGAHPLDLAFHLSPGTPAMAATWVLLGKSRYPATLYQTHRGKAAVAEIPFDLTVDFVPHLLRDPDRSLQALAARSPREVEGFEAIVGESRSIRLAAGRAQKAALRDVSVLVVGESGTGKELFARAIHAASPRRGGRFAAINCAAIPKELLESELFGHAKGAFTGADAHRAGAFEEAEGGPSSSTRSASATRRCRPSSSGSCSPGPAMAPACGSSAGSASRRTGLPTCGSSPRPTATSSPRSKAVASGKTCTTGSPSSRSSCRRSGSGRPTSRWSPGPYSIR